MEACSQKISQNISIILQNSGHSFQQYGQYEQCLQLGSKFSYNFLTINLTNNSLIPTVYMGLCLPQQCNPSIVKLGANNIFQNMNLSAAVTEVNNQVQNFHYVDGWIFYFAIIFVAILLTMTIYSTYAKYRKKESILNMFSWQQTSKYFRRNQKNNLNVFNGIKSIAMFLVIFLHVFKNTRGANTINKLQQNRYYSKLYFLIAYKGEGSVAIFLYVAGFLVSYVVIKQIMKDNWACVVNILHRVLRILPSFLFVIMLYLAFYLHLGSGQLWAGQKNAMRNCQKFWRVIFFVNNFFGDLCYGNGWYLNVDMQLYAFSMLILLLFKYQPIASKILIWILILIGIIQLFVFCQITSYAIPIRLQDIQRTGVSWTFQYLRPWKWMAAYFLGLYFGILYYQYSQQSKINKTQQIKIQTVKSYKVRNQILSKLQFVFKTNKKARVCCQILGLLLILFYMFIPRTLQLNIQWSQTSHSLYESTQYFGFALGVNFLILPSILGCKNSIVCFILDTNLFNFISKISFMTYLIHINFVRAQQLTLTSTFYFQLVPKFVDFVSISMISMFFAFFSTILVQVPFSNLHKLLLAKLKSKGTQQQKDKFNKKASERILIEDVQNIRLMKNQQ